MYADEQKYFGRCENSCEGVKFYVGRCENVPKRCENVPKRCEILCWMV